MPTHALGTGTRNVSVNVPVDEFSLWGQLAFRMIESGKARSTGDALRKVMLRGLEATDAKAAAQLKEIRARYYASALTVLICAATLTQWLGVADMDQMRRSGGTVRVVRVQRGKEEA